MGCKIYQVPDVKKNPVGYAARLFNIIKDERIDIVHYNMLSAANIVPIAVARLAGCKRVIAHSHNAGTVGMHKYILHYINRGLIPFLATDLFTCSPKAGCFMFGRKRGKGATLIRNAIDVKKFSFNQNARKKIRGALGIADDISLIGHVGRFAEAKNHVFLIEIFRRISQKRQSVKLLLVGTGHLEARIRRIVEKYQIVDKVIFYGTTDTPHEIYSAMDAFALPSFFEGLSVVGIEAQCNGLQVIASDTLSKRMDILGQVKWRNLSKDSPQIWADTVLECLKKRKTEDVSKMMAESGYDIDIEALRLGGIYLR
jgi:glycosyltransferase involved in cell wall biosynthesis